MDLIQSKSYFASKFLSYTGTSILSLPPNLVTSLNKRSFATSSPTTYSTSTSSLSASLMSPTSGALLYSASIVSNLVRSSHIFLSTTRLAKGASPCLLGSIVLIVYHTQSTSLSYLSPPFLFIFHLNSIDEEFRL
jgi:hypothetical protein